jgi:hypothetical protein
VIRADRVESALVDPFHFKGPGLFVPIKPGKRLVGVVGTLLVYVDNVPFLGVFIEEDFSLPTNYFVAQKTQIKPV